MSRIGKQEINIPAGTTVTQSDAMVHVKGPKGELSREFKDAVAITIEGDTIRLAPAKESRLAQALWGTYASHLKNMIAGVNTPYEKKLIVEGVGFKVNVEGNKLRLSVGFSHDVELPIPDGIDVTVEKNVIGISGINKELVGSFAGKVRAQRKPEPYKGKGIRYIDEVIRRKQGKKAA